MEAIKIDTGERDETVFHKSAINKNFDLTESFKIQQFTDSCLNLVKIEKSKEKEMLDSNRQWGQKAGNIYNLRRLCFELLEPIEKLAKNKMLIVCGITNPAFTKLMGLDDYSQLKHGKAAIFRVNFINNFKVFQMIIESNLKFSELIYFSKDDVIYAGLPAEVLKDVVKVK
jgi:hypothetical protein